jgi:hypothetical protein
MMDEIPDDGVLVIKRVMLDSITRSAYNAGFTAGYEAGHKDGENEPRRQ